MGDFMNSISKMTADMHNTRDALRKYNDELEEKVAERTADLTRANEQIRENEQRFRLIAENIQEVFWLATPDISRIIYLNPAFEKVWGLPAERVYENPALWMNLVHPEDRAALYAALETHRDGQYDVEYRIVRPDGEIRNIRDRGFPVCEASRGVAFRTGIAEDVTTRKLIEEALQQSEKKYRTLFESSSDAIMLLDENGFFDCNKATLSMFGLSKKEDFLKLHPSQVSPPYQPDGVDSLTAANHNIAEAFMTGSHLFEWVHRRENGEDFFADVLLTVFLFKKKPVLQATVRDISDRKKADEQIKKLNTELELRVSKRTAQLEAANTELKDFAYVVSHDLKAPLRGISALANWLATDYADKLDEQGRDFLNLLVQRATRMDSLISGILEYSRVGRVKEEMKLMELDTVVSDVINLLAPPDRVVVTIETKLPAIVCEPTRIYQVFQNLIGNAVQHLDKPNGEVRVGFLDEGGLATFYVADNGPGIEAKYFAKIFEMFQTLKPRDEVENTGVGLTIVKKIVEMYGGRIWVESKIGAGTTFWFTLPATANEATNNTGKDDQGTV